DPVRVVISGLRTSYTIGTGAKAAELTPGQLLERMGFSSAQLSTPVKDLSGGQQRRLQLLLILLDQPNVLILDEPTNDLDTDMLSAIEDLLDSWAGTLLVVSHDRYFLERVTDQQYAVLGGRLRHLPGGIDEYLRLREHERAVSAAGGAAGAPAGSAAQGGPGAQASAVPALAGADLRAAQKELAAAERRIEKLTAQADAARTALAEHDQADYVGLGEKMAKIGELDAEVAALEERWFALTDLIG
ncbi:MAG TPA: ATP-binding cassette domain-containing protein, partial [Microbacterium sp.]|nr:ATP-binding cassette domain-containing protein [Microbacterium sp.]